MVFFITHPSITTNSTNKKPRYLAGLDDRYKTIKYTLSLLKIFLYITSCKISHRTFKETYYRCLVIYPPLTINGILVLS